MAKKKKPRGSSKPKPYPLHYYQSPVTGDVGFSDHPWLRLDDRALALPTPTIMCDVAELILNGYDPTALGMICITDMNGPTEIPAIPLTADMSSRYDVDLYELNSPDMNNPVRVVGGAFTDPHPDEWWNRLHNTDQPLTLVAGDTPTIVQLANTDPTRAMAVLYDKSWIGLISGLMIRAWPTGVGTRRPE